MKRSNYTTTVTYSRNYEPLHTEPMLASSPQDKKVYEQFIASRRRSDSEDRGDEVATLPAEEIEKVGSSVFHRDDAGLFLFDIARIGRSFNTLRLLQAAPCRSLRYSRRGVTKVQDAVTVMADDEATVEDAES